MTFRCPRRTDFSFLSASPYVRKDMVFTAIAEGARTHVRLDVYDRKREYIQALLPDEDTEGVLFNVARDIGRDLYGEFEVRYEDILRGQQTIPTPGPVSFHGYDRDATLRLSWEAYRNFLASGEVGFLARSGDREYDGEWAALRFRYTVLVPWSAQLHPPAQQMLEEHGRYASASPCNAMTVDVEEHFQVAAFEDRIRRDAWEQPSLPRRAEYGPRARCLRRARRSCDFLHARLGGRARPDPGAPDRRRRS